MPDQPYKSRVESGSTVDQVIERVRDVVHPIRSRVDQVERELHDHEARTQRQIDRMEQVATDALRGVASHVERLTKLEAIPERMLAIEVEVRNIGSRTLALETKAVEQAARIEGRRDVGRNIRWVAENWFAIAAILALMGFGVAAYGSIGKLVSVADRVLHIETTQDPKRDGLTAWPYEAPEETVLRGRGE
jgi:hypothetical protein